MKSQSLRRRPGAAAVIETRHRVIDSVARFYVAGDLGGEEGVALHGFRASPATMTNDNGMMKAFQRVTREITSTLDLDHLLRVVLDEALNFSQADAGCIGLFSDDALQIKAAHGYAEEDLARLATLAAANDPLADGAIALRDWLTRGEAVYVPHAASESSEGTMFSELRSVLTAPIFYEQRLAGVILLHAALADAFSPAVVEFIEGLALQAAVAVGNAQRYEEQLQRSELMHRRAEQMSLLLEVTRTMRSDRPLEDVLLDVAYAVQEGTGFELVLISVLEGNLLHRVAGAGISLAELEKRKAVRLPWNRVQQLCQERFRMGQCYYIPEQYTEEIDDLDILVSEGPAPRQGKGQWQNKDLFFLPLRGSAGDVLGIMSVDRPLDGKAPTAMTAEVIELFASQGALAIENSRLVENLRRQVTTLQLFNELNRSITTKLDLPLVLNTVVQSVTNLLEYDFSTIFLRNQSGAYFTPMASSGYTLELLNEVYVAADKGFAADVARSGLPLVIEDAQRDATLASIGVPIGSSIAVPLIVDGRSVGILTADRKERGDFSPADVGTLTALADQVAVAVENARLFEEVKRFNEELEARVAERTQALAEALERLRFQRDRSEVLYHIASELVASLDIDRVLSQALLLLQRAVQASRSSVILLDPTSGQLFYRAAIGHTQRIPPGGKVAPFRRNEGIVGSVLQTRQAIIVSDVLKQDQGYERCDAVEGARSILAVPVLGSAGEALGVILMQSPIVDAFDEAQLRLVEAAAIQLGNALNNAELYRLIREQAERLGTMLRAQQIDAAKNQAILEGIADGVMVADAEGDIILFNAAAERILSIDRTQALGRRQDEILGLYGSESQNWLSQIEAWRDHPETYVPETFLAHRLEVGHRFVAIHLSPVVANGGEYLGVVSVFRDITSEIEADRAKSDFVSTVSHELRTPMTSIVGYVDLMIHGAVGELSEMQLSFLKKVKTNADRLTNLVNDLLDISRIEQGRIELLREPLAIEGIITQVLELMRPRVQEKAQALEVSVPSSLPKVYGDPARLTQILTNLVSNAYKYTPSKGEVTVYAYVRDGMMHVAVADTGIGIARENQEKIFERFYRVEDDPAVYEVSGTGLGLAITLSLIQMHGGHIELESELGVGSIFTFSLPLAEGELTDDVGSLPPPLITASAPVILVVEDDAQIVELLKVTLTSEGMEVLTASSGEDALRLARQQLPDLISLDIRLPDLDGFEVLQLLKREPETADIPVVIVSVVGDSDQGLALGAVDYLTKPLDAQEFLSVIKRTVQPRDFVVVADGDKHALNVMRHAFQLRGVGVRTTQRGERALQLAREVQPAVMIVDSGIFAMDGHNLLERLGRTQQASNISLVVTTELQPNDVIEKMENLDITRVIRKPYPVEEVVADICAWLNHNGDRKES